ncbi:MAG: hypothetical protein RI947_1153 [Candidatus Parcubacteria bacterium]|jgi:hypothetical protein
MPDSPEGVAEVKRPLPEATDVAAVIRQPGKAEHAHVKALQNTLNRMAELGGVYQPMPMGNTDTMVDRNELGELVASERDAKRHKKLETTLGTINEILDQEPKMKSRTIIAAGEILGKIPGFVLAVAHDTGLTPDQVQRAFAGDIAAGGGQANVDKMAEIVEYHLKNPAFRMKLEQILARIQLPEEDLETHHRMQELEQQMGKAKVVQDEVTKLKAAQAAIGMSEADAKQLSADIQSLRTAIDRIPDAYKPDNEDDDTSYGDVIGEISRKKTRLEGERDDAVNPPDKNRRNKLNDEIGKLEDAEIRVNKARTLAKKVGTKRSDYLQYKTIDEQVNQYNEQLKGVSAMSSEYIKLRNKRDRLLAQQKRRMETALESALITYWNDDILKKATDAAFTKAQAKETEEEKKKEKAAGMENRVRGFFDKYLQLAYFEYGHGNAGEYQVDKWDDKWIRDNVNAIAMGPEAMFDRMVHRMDYTASVAGRSMSANLIEAMNELGIRNVTGGTYEFPDLTPEVKRKIGSELVAKMLGLAQYRQGDATIFNGKRFWNEIRFDKAKATQMYMMYGPDFFNQVLANKHEFQHIANDIMGKDILNVEDEKLLENLKEMYGKNPAEASRKLFKVAAIGSALLAIASPLGLLGVAGVVAAGVGHQAARSLRGTRYGV